MKKLFFLVTMCLLLVSCGSKADNTVTKFIDNIKNKKIDAAMKYTKNEDFVHDNMNIAYGNKTQEMIFETLFREMNYKVIQTKKESDELTVVKVEIENIDLGEVFTKLMVETVKDVKDVKDGGSSVSHEYLEKKLSEILQSNDLPKLKATTEFKVYKTKDGSKIDLSSDNINVMFGKIYTSIEHFGKTKNSNDEEKKVETENVQPTPQPMQKK